MKIKKPKQPITYLDRARETLLRILDEENEANKKAGENVLRLMEQRDEILAEIQKKKVLVEAQVEEYHKIEEQLRERTSQALLQENITEDDVKAGRTTMHEFYQHGVKIEQLQAQARADAESKLTRPRKIIRDLNAEIIGLSAKAASLDVSIQLNINSGGENFKSTLKKMLERMDQVNIEPMAMSRAYHSQKAARNDELLLQGSAVNQPKTWELRSIQEVEALIFDPIIKEEHFPDLQKLIQELKGQGWAAVTLHYSPSIWGGRPAGFQYSLRAAILRGEIHE